MVMNEQWQEANSVFAELAMAFPESEYCDDALYWAGYSLFQSNDLGEAIEAYNQLIYEFPASQYYDDAVADMTVAETQRQIDQISRELQQTEHALQSRQMEAHTRDLQRQLERLTWNRVPLPDGHSPGTDPETQLRIDALNALSPVAGDKASFETLKEVALDGTNPIVLREHAVHIIADADADLAFPVFVTLAKSDTSEAIRVISLDYLAQAPGDKSVDALIDVFHTIPPQQAELSARVFYTIAEVGNDRAVDFLSSVARRHEDMALRREAVFYLGAIGSERSRAALQAILKGRD